MADLFDNPAQTGGADNEVPRDKWGRPLIVPPGAGKRVAYTRVTRFVGAADDTYNLSRWMQRNVAFGMSRRDDLILAAASLSLSDKKKLDEIVDRANEAANSKGGATKGTALHTFTEQHDRGEDLGFVPSPYDRDLEAYKHATAGLKYAAIEQFRVCDTYKIAGTADRLVDFGDRYVIADIKGLSLDTKIPTPNGWTTMGEIRVGDVVFGDDGQPCNVVVKSDAKRIGTYVVTFDDGSKVVCDSEHIWWTSTASERRKKAYNGPTAKSITEVIETLRDKRGQAHHCVPVADPLQLPDAELPIDPYVLGCWLGDGHKRDGCITKTDELFDEIQSRGFELGVRQKQPKGKEHIATRTVVGLNRALHDAGLRGHKRVPSEYFRASIGQRLELLRGLMDTDGTWNKPRKRVAFQTVDKGLAMDVHELATSLGERVMFAEHAGHGFGRDVTVYVAEWTPVRFNPFSMHSKASRVDFDNKRLTHAKRRVIVSVEEGPDVETACIGVDSENHTYLCGENMIPTHNTGSIDYGAGKIAAQLASYANGIPYDPKAQSRYEDSKPVDRTTGLVIHLPVGTGTCHLYWLDIAEGWKTVDLCDRIWKWRKAKTEWLTPVNPGELEVATRPKPVGDSGVYAGVSMRAVTDPGELADATQRVTDRPDVDSLVAQALSFDDVKALRQWYQRLDFRGHATPEVLAACQQRASQLA